MLLDSLKLDLDHIRSGGMRLDRLRLDDEDDEDDEAGCSARVSPGGAECANCLRWTGQYSPVYACAVATKKPKSVLPPTRKSLFCERMPGGMLAKGMGTFMSGHQIGVDVDESTQVLSQSVIGFVFPRHAWDVYVALHRLCEQRHFDVGILAAADTFEELRRLCDSILRFQHRLTHVEVLGLVVGLFTAEGDREKAMPALIQVCYVWCTSTNTRLCALPDLLQRSDWVVEPRAPLLEAAEEREAAADISFLFPDRDADSLPDTHLSAIHERPPRGFRESEVAVLKTAFVEWIERFGSIATGDDAERSFKRLGTQQCLFPGFRRRRQERVPHRPDLAELPAWDTFEDSVLVAEFGKEKAYQVLASLSVPLQRQVREALGVLSPHDRLESIDECDEGNAGAIEQLIKDNRAIRAVTSPFREIVKDAAILAIFRVLFMAQVRCEFSDEYFHTLLNSDRHIHTVAEAADPFRAQESIDTSFAGRQRKRLRGPKIAREEMPYIVTSMLGGDKKPSYKMVVRERPAQGFGDRPVYTSWEYDNILDALCAWLVYVRDFRKGKLESGFPIDALLEDITGLVAMDVSV